MALRFSGRSSQMVATAPSRVARIGSPAAVLIAAQCAPSDAPADDTVGLEEERVGHQHLAIAAALMATTVACGSSGGGSVGAFCDQARAAKSAADVQQGLF